MDKIVLQKFQIIRITSQVCKVKYRARLDNLRSLDNNTREPSDTFLIWKLGNVKVMVKKKDFNSYPISYLLGGD